MVSISTGAGAGVLSEYASGVVNEDLMRSDLSKKNKGAQVPHQSQFKKS
jgi:hypothetical protein